MDNISAKSVLFLRMAINDDRMEDFDASPEEYKLIFHELQQHTVSALACEFIYDLNNIPADLLKQWERENLSQVYYYAVYTRIQEAIKKKLNEHCIPFVILKGTSVACYYPHPEFRAMGDIDIITRREDIDRACSAVEEAEFVRIDINNDFGRTIKYKKNNFEIEIHRYFSSLNDPQRAEYLDDLILKNINGKISKLPDNINGLVLLEHIGDHLEHGLGLRQIIDWMMYVRKCLNDDKWNSWFQLQAKKIGLEKLAVVVTRMCQIYLGLEETIRWPHTADDRVCMKLMEYIMASGNFGRKQAKNVQKRETVEAMVNNHGLLQMIRLLQKYGENNWNLLKRYNFLKPFAWAYQMGHSIKKRMANHINAGEVFAEYRESKARKALFEELEVKQYSKGLAVLNGDHFEIQRK